MKTVLVNFGTVARTLLLATAALTLANCASSPGGDGAEYRPAPGSTFLVYVRPGDTVSEIAERYRVSDEDIIAINSIANSDQILSGDQLYVPAYGIGRPPVEEAPVRQAAAAPRNNAIQRADLPAPQAQQASYRWNNPTVAPRPAPRQAPQAAPPISASSAKFVWPVSGPVVANFGTGSNGEKNDGINIVVPRGTPFRAAGAGTVTYVGNELRGFGNLLLIRHDNGYVTAYAHADTIHVARGERVAEGQIVGEVGATGDVSEPQLHFEIREGTRPVNPSAHLVNGRTNQASLTPSDPAKS